jgi:hypothetical protein
MYANFLRFLEKRVSWQLLTNIVELWKLYKLICNFFLI